MNQLTKQGEITPRKESLAILPHSFVELRLGHKPIKEMSVNGLKRVCTDVLTKSSFDAGSPMGDSPMILQAQTESLFAELKGRYLLLTLPELQEAFNRGVRNESGPYFGFCAKTYNQFLKHFFDIPERGKQWIEYLSKSDLPKSDKPVQFTREHLVRAAKTAFEDYKTGGKMPIISHAIYDTIKDLQGVKTLMSTEDWPIIKQEAKTSYKTERCRGLRKSQIEALILDYTMENRSYEFHVKKIGLKYFFENLIKSGKDLEL